jgi:hypothetical protein
MTFGSGFGKLGNAFGKQGASSGGTPEDAAPTIVSLSIVPDGGPQGTLFSAALTWTGFPRTGVTYEWRSGGAPIGGETGATYLSDTPIALLTVAVTINNGIGTDSAVSAAVEVTALSALLLEIGDNILLESGDRILLEAA